MFLLNIEEMERSEITLVKIIHYRQLHQDFLYFIYLFLQCNNTKLTQNRQGYTYKIATVSIKQKAVDRVKTTLRFWFNATRFSARMTSKTTTFVTSISDIVM